MTTIAAEELRRSNRDAQRRRRQNPEAREVDRRCMEAKRKSACFRAAANMAGKQERRNPDTWARVAIRHIRHRAKLRGLECTISAADLALPEICPVLGIQIVIGTDSVGGMSHNSPSVDRFDNTKGYTPENVRVISNRANILKKDATISEVRALLAYMEQEGAP